MVHNRRPRTERPAMYSTCDAVQCALVIVGHGKHGVPGHARRVREVRDEPATRAADRRDRQGHLRSRALRSIRGTPPRNPRRSRIRSWCGPPWLPRRHRTWPRQLDPPTSLPSPALPKLPLPSGSTGPARAFARAFARTIAPVGGRVRHDGDSDLAATHRQGPEGEAGNPPCGVPPARWLHHRTRPHTAREPLLHSQTKSHCPPAFKDVAHFTNGANIPSRI